MLTLASLCLNDFSPVYDEIKGLLRIVNSVASAQNDLFTLYSQSLHTRKTINYYAFTLDACDASSIQ